MNVEFEYPLAALFNRCNTLCDPECCGIDAYDFSPIHIASFLIMSEGKINQGNVDKLNHQLNELKVNYGSTGLISCGATSNRLNQIFSGNQIDSLVLKIQKNLAFAILLVKENENNTQLKI